MTFCSDYINKINDVEGGGLPGQHTAPLFPHVSRQFGCKSGLCFALR